MSNTILSITSNALSRASISCTFNDTLNDELQRPKAPTPDLKAPVETKDDKRPAEITEHNTPLLDPNDINTPKTWVPITKIDN